MPETTAAARRRALLVERMRAAGLDAMLITVPENRQYLTGFFSLDHEAGSVLITADRVAILTDLRYSEQAAEEAPDCEVNHNERREPLAVVVAEQLKQWGGPAGATPTLGFEAAHLTVAQFEQLREKGAGLFTLQATTDLVEPLRAVKDAEEIAFTRRATEITSQTFDHLLSYLRQPDLTEQQVVAEIVTTMLRLGADGLAFDPHVAAGPNGARPHARPGDRVLAAGQPIIIDMGARYRGYCADMTRTVFLDHVPAVWADRYGQVLRAQEACEAGLRAGISGKAADALARDVLDAAGLAATFTHSTGHGTGLAIHEAPNLSQRAPEDQPLPAGAIVTIEPGVYLPGEGGIRIEDAAVLTPDGCDILTEAPKALAAMIVRR